MLLALSVNSRLKYMLPDFVIPSFFSLCPEESSPTVSPTKFEKSQALPNLVKSPTSDTIETAVTISIPLKQISFSTFSLPSSSFAISFSRFQLLSVLLQECLQK